MNASELKDAFNYIDAYCTKYRNKLDLLSLQIDKTSTLSYKFAFLIILVVCVF